MKYLTKSEVDASFDERFPGFDPKSIAEILESIEIVQQYQQDIPIFISSIRTADLDALIEHLEEKLKDARARYAEFGLQSIEGEISVLSDMISHLKELKETNK